MIVLSVDYGDRRTGIAVSDATGFLASPVAVIEEWNPQALAEKIAALAEQRKAQQIVIGLPRNMDGSCGFRSEACRALGDLITALCPIPVCYWDERLTTVSAHRIMNENNVRGKKRKAVIDAVSAQLILQDYLDSMQSK